MPAPIGLSLALLDREGVRHFPPATLGLRRTPQRPRQPALASSGFRDGEVGDLRRSVWSIWCGGGGGGRVGAGCEAAAAAGSARSGVEVVG